ncbi:MAG: DUF1559 domain-containing protein [Planctomycetes bacterium]|nr:DUF1559 domain-containing protein [Planctomycetota bacterium]MCG2682572.1 DUF1559 domain-containing protein [Planctomycetales bacterium]
MPNDSQCPHCCEQNDATTANDVAAERPRSKAKITCLIVFILFFVVGVVFLWCAVLAAREAARDCACRCHLKQITLAMHNYHQAYKCLPPAYIADADGKPMHSWRVLLLPYLSSYDVYKRYRFDEPWDSPNNLAVAAVAKEAALLFHCPSQPEVDYPITNYVMVVGPHTISDGPHSRKFEEIIDGISNTIMVVEVADSGIRWTEPRDLQFDEIDFGINGEKRPGIGSYHRQKIHVAMCDSAVITLADSTPPEVVKALTTIDGGEDVEPPEK